MLNAVVLNSSRSNVNLGTEHCFSVCGAAEPSASRDGELELSKLLGAT
jgi:hypothetical protein